MNIAKNIKNPVSNSVSISIWDEVEAELKNTLYYDMAYNVCDMIQVPINESVWMSAYDGVYNNI